VNFCEVTCAIASRTAVAGADRDGALGDDDGEAGEAAADLAGRLEQVAEIGGAVGARRGADREEHDLGVRERLRGCRW